MEYPRLVFIWIFLEIFVNMYFRNNFSLYLKVNIYHQCVINKDFRTMHISQKVSELAFSSKEMLFAKQDI